MRHALVIFSALAVIVVASRVVAETSGNPKHGEKIYQQLCVRCHGDKLDGRGPEAQYLKVAPADLQSLSSRMKSDWELLVIVSHGIMFTPMHGFRDVLSEQDIKDVVAFIRTIAPFKPVASVPSHPAPALAYQPDR